MTDLISKQEVIDALENLTVYDVGEICDLLYKLESLPSAELERKKGKWLKWEAKNGIDTGIECSVCGFVSYTQPGYGTNYCPNCGADMNEETKNLIEFCKTTTERILQRFFDFNHEYEEWEKEFPNGTLEEFFDDYWKEV